MREHDIVPAHLAVQAMRDSGYKNAAYALAELMDNSIQAEATLVELLCGEKRQVVQERWRSRIEEIAVLDNGTGMTAETLRLALQFGNGTHLNEDSQAGIGRFGMGLPNSSVSQCRRVDVWTWQAGLGSAIHTYLDIDKIKKKELTEVPPPEPRAVPEIWTRVASSFGQSGTLVVWSKIDRCVWRTARAIIDNSEFLIGRMYRRFLENDNVRIRMVSFDLDDPGSLVEEFASPNDPGYLMERTSCPAPYDVKPLFNPWGEDGNHVASIPISFRGKTHVVKVTFSSAKEEARKGHNPGEREYGQHAARNVGVSIVRAGRELELDQSWVIKYDPVERWWGIEVEFPPALDDLFGVTNNKQSARNFAELVRLDVEALLKGGKTIQQLKAELEDEEDPRGPLVELANLISIRVKLLRRLLAAQTKGARGSVTRHTVAPAEQVATAATRERQAEGFSGQSDKDETLPSDERKGIIEETLIDAGLMQSTAEEIAAKTVTDGLKYVFAEAEIESPAFFSVRPKGGAVIITLNTAHPAYAKLVDVLEREGNGSDAAALQTRLANALEGLKLLFMAWARYEDEQPDGIRRARVQETRTEWGSIARKFLERD